MKKILLLLLPVFLFACKKESSLPLNETITEGEKWGIQIGSSPAEVYAQLQALNIEKDFEEVAIVYRQPFAKPEDIQEHLPYYHALTLQNTNSSHIERVLLEFGEEKIDRISAGGALPAEVLKWPEDVSDEIAIHNDTPLDQLYDKLLAIYELPAYRQHQIILPNKPLSKPFDPDMVKYDEWAFTFYNEISSGRVGISAVRLYFSNGKLNKIQHLYDEQNVYN